MLWVELRRSGPATVMTARCLRGAVLVCCTLWAVMLPACEMTIGEPVPREALQAITLAVNML